MSRQYVGAVSPNQTFGATKTWCKKISHFSLIKVYDAQTWQLWLLLRNSSVMVLYLPYWIIFFFITGALTWKQDFVSKSVAVYVLPEVMILPLGMTITSIITNWEMKYKSKIVSKLMVFKSFPGSCQTTLNISMLHINFQPEKMVKLY